MLSGRARILTALAPLAPALLAGAHATGLLFFLNPELPTSLAALARGTLFYGALLAPFSWLAHLALGRRRGVKVPRLLPWTLTLVIAAGALGDWVHASYYAYFLPPGINVQLIKTALWLSLGSVLVFYTALLHTVPHRRFGPRSRLLILSIALGTVFVMFDRRTSFRPPAPAPPRLLEVDTGEAPRLVVVALSTATLDALLPLAEQGKLPFFAALFEQGASVRLAGFGPSRPVALWASWATAKLPYRHGLVGDRVFVARPLGAAAELQLLPVAVGFERWGLAGGGVRPVAESERRALPIWEILARVGRRTLVGGFGPELGVGSGGLPPSGERRGRLGAEQALVESGRSLLATALAGDRARIAAVRARSVAPDPPAAIFVRLEGLESAALETFGGFVRTEFEGSRAGEATRAAEALTDYLAGLDAELAALWEALPAPRLLAVTSAYGAAAPSGIRRLASELSGGERAGGTLSGPPDGVLLLRGDDVRSGVQLPEARIVDVAPTLLYALGLPIARDFDGRVLIEGFDPALLQRRALSFVPTYEGLPPVTSDPAAR